MYRPRAFAVDDRDLLVGLMRRHPFATIVGVIDGVPEIAHVPLLVEDGEPLRITGHLARANPLVQVLEEEGVLTAVFHGPHAYVSPRFYVTTPNVPTWNYVVVHARGGAHALRGHEASMAHLRAVVDAFEADAPRPWAIDDVRQHAERIAPGMVAFELRVESLEGKWKLNQNRSRDDWEAVRARFGASADATEREMAALMERLGPP